MISLLNHPAAKAATTRLPITADTAGTAAAGAATGSEAFSARLTQACSAEAPSADLLDPGQAGLLPGSAAADLPAGAAPGAEAAPASGAPTPEMLLALLSDTQAAGNPALPDAAQAGAAAAALGAFHSPISDGGTKPPSVPLAAGEVALLPTGARPDAPASALSGLPEPARRQPLSDDPADRLTQASAATESATHARAATEAFADHAASSAGAALSAAAPSAAAAPPMLATLPAARTELQAPATITIGTPVGNPYFSEETAQHVSWLVGNGIEQARINVHPADLGPIEIRISMHNGEAIISFAVTQPETSAAIEDAMPRLREMLAENGISLGQTSVGGEGSDFAAPAGESADDRRLRLASAATLRDEAVAAETPNLAAAQRSAARNGMVDLFA